MLRYLTAGESHGPALIVIVEGLPAGLAVTIEQIGDELARRRLGYGRGPRMRFERDEVEFLGGVRHGRTLGSPVAIEIGNTEWPKWERGDVARARAPPSKPLHPAPPRPRRPRRHAEVRLRRRPRRARARQRPRDRRPGRRRRARQGPPRRARHRDPEPRGADRRGAAPSPAAGPARPTCQRSTTRRCAASTPTPRRR